MRAATSMTLLDDGCRLRFIGKNRDEEAAELVFVGKFLDQFEQ